VLVEGRAVLFVLRALYVYEIASQANTNRRSNCPTSVNVASFCYIRAILSHEPTY
jgi:hypothetical protein